MSGILSLAVASVCVAFALDDCKECAPRKLCAPHQAEEAAALKSVAADLKSKDESARKKGLEKIAALKDGHENAPSAAAAKALAAGLEDPSWPVRTATVKLLAKGQDRDVALVAITKSLEASRKDGAKWMTFCSMSGLTPEQKIFAEYLKATSEALAAMKDEAAGRALLEFLSKAAMMPEDMLLPVVQAVGTVGTQEAFELVVDKFEQTEGMGGGSRAYHAVLARVAMEHGGKGLPAFGRGTAAKWKKWLDANRELFPKKVAKM